MLTEESSMFQHRGEKGVKVLEHENNLDYMNPNTAIALMAIKSIFSCLKICSQQTHLGLINGSVCVLTS